MALSPLPIFPLGTVLLPGGLLPLRVFEPRYVTLLGDIAEDPEFGSVLIERGSEVGGGDERMPLGTIAQIISRTARGAQIDIVVVGTKRFEVTEWLEDAPYPRANVSILEEPASETDDAGRVVALTEQWRQLSEELTRSAHQGLAPLDQLVTDPALFSFQAAALAPIGSLDRYRILAAPTPAERLEALTAILRDHTSDIRQARALD